MTYVKFYVYRCITCGHCIHTYVEKNNCVKCGHPWETDESFYLSFPGNFFEDE